MRLRLHMASNDSNNIQQKFGIGSTTITVEHLIPKQRKLECKWIATGLCYIIYLDASNKVLCD